MATSTQPYSKTGGRAAPVGINRAETLWWRYMRLSGILLVPLVFGHLFIVHLINSVAVINYEWVIDTRWHFFGWRIYDAVMLWFAGVHGFRGFLYVVDDYIHNKTLNRAVRIGFTLAMIVGLGMGSIAIVGTPYR